MSNGQSHRMYNHDKQTNKNTKLHRQRALVLIAGFRARLAGLKLGYPENPALINTENPGKLGSLIFLIWVRAGLAGF